MKRFLLVAILLVLSIFPVHAQEACDIDLLDEISALTAAQKAADSGDTAAAAQLLTEVQEQLAAQLESCAGGAVALPATFEFPDGLFRFNYPEGWATLSPVNGVYVLGNNQSALNTIVDSDMSETLPAGTQVVIAAYGDIKAVFNADSFANFLVEIQAAELANSASFISPEAVVINDYRGVKLAVSSDLFDGAAYVLNLHTNKVAFFVALTPHGEFDEFEPTFTALVSSMQVGEKRAAEDQTLPSTTGLIPNAGTPLDEIIYAQGINITDLIDDVDPHLAALAPDGTRIAWVNRQDKGSVCLYTLANKSTQCQALPETFNSRPPVLLWSPDSRYIAFTQDGLRAFHEPDIWVFDTENQTYANRTDDNINRWRPFREPDPGDSPGPLWFDHTFTWGPDGNIYFVRLDVPTTTDDLDNGTTGLYRLSPAGGEAELIRDLTGDFERFSIYQQQQYNLSGAMAVSPDATQIAFIVMEHELDSPHNGVWVMPLSGDEAPRQLVRATDLKRGTNIEFQESENFLFPEGLAWTPDQSGLYLFTFNPMYSTDAVWILYHLSLADGALTPLTDFSRYTRPDLFKQDETTGHALLYYLPRAVVMSPDGTTPLIFHFEPAAKQGGLSALTLSANGVERTPLLEFEYQPIPGMVASVAADGKLLLLGALLLPAE